MSNFKFLSVVIFSLLTTSAHAGVLTLDGEYKFIGTDGKSPVRFTMTLKEGKMTTSREDGSFTQTVDAEITDGGQPDFMLAIHNMVPTGMTLFKTTADVVNDTKPAPLTFVKQTLSKADPHLTIYIVGHGQPIGIVGLYDSTQTAVYENLWLSMQAEAAKK